MGGGINREGVKRKKFIYLFFNSCYRNETDGDFT